VQTTSASRSIATARAVARCLALSSFLLILGCHSFRAENEPTTRLDTGTGATVANANELMVFARLDARYSRSTRDYVYLAPAETNRQGLREYFLWVGVGSTLDRGYLAPETALPTRLEFTVRDEPMEFELTRWPPAYLSADSANLFDTPVALRGQLAARVTLDQLALVDANPPDSIRVQAGDGRIREFIAWPTSSSWSQFLAQRR
jgi:hypothetical protein